ncbi:MAG: hypothetical protein IE885_05060 [Campylobacterales bacterium]|nr:hypothetical protein [Campylobacterales bacterium]
MKYFLVFLSVAVWLLSACAPKQYQVQQPAMIVFKTPTLRYADLGFIYESDTEVKVEIYSNAQPLMALQISGTNICMSSLACMSKAQFNQKILSQYYPAELLEQIFKGRPIFEGVQMEKNRNGFTQKITADGKYGIEYSVFNKEILFRDTINDILIKVKKQG